MVFKPIRILFTINNFDTAGMKYILYDIIKNIDRSLFEPSVCVKRDCDTKLNEEIRKLVKHYIILDCKKHDEMSYKEFLKKAFKSIRTLKKYKFDVQHSFNYSDDWTEGLIAKLAGHKWIYTKTNMNWGSGQWKIKSFFADKIVCLSNAQKRIICKSNKLNKKVVLIPIGINIKKFSFKRDKRIQYRKELGIKEGEFCLVCVANLVEVKGHKELLEAFSLNLKKHPNNKLVLVGGGTQEYTEKLQNLVKELGINKKVIFLGKRTDVPDLLSAFDGFILPTRNIGRKEAFGAVLIEAMAAGLPVIGTRSGGPEDIIVPGKTGWLISPEGVEPIVKAIGELVSNKELRKTYAENGLKRAREMFNLELMIKKHQDLYLELNS